MMKIESGAFPLIQSYQNNRSSLEDSMIKLSSGDNLRPVGSEPAAYTSISDRLRNQIALGRASSDVLNRNLNFLAAADKMASLMSDVINNMSSTAIQARNDPDNSASYQTIFNSQKEQLISLSHSLHGDKQIASRDVIASYDGNAGAKTLRFWDTNGNAASEMDVKLENSSATDAMGNHIGFDASRSFTTSFDGRSLYYIGDDGSSNYTIRKYDIQNNMVEVGATVAAIDTLYIEPDNSLYINAAGTLQTVSTDSLALTAVGTIVDMEAGSNFSVSDTITGTAPNWTTGNVITYVNSSNELARYNITTSTAIAGSPYDVTGGTFTFPGATPGATFADGVDHAISATGYFAADEYAQGNIRLLSLGDSTNLDGVTIDLTASGISDISDLQFNQDGTRLYFIDVNANAVKFLDFSTDTAGAISYNLNDSVIQGSNSSSLQGLSLTGANPGSTYEFSVFTGATTQRSYTALNTNLLTLGLVNSNVNTVDEASQAVFALEEAHNRIVAANVKANASYTRFEMTRNAVTGFTTSTEEADAMLHDVNLAEETAKVAKFEILNQTAAAMLAQMNSIVRSNLLTLIQG